MIEFNINSNDHISLLLFGGEVLEDVKVENGVFKGGKTPGEVKYKNVKQQVKIEGLGLKPLKEWKNKKERMYSTKEDVLKILSQNKSQDCRKLVNLLLEIRELQKVLSTYYEGMEEKIYKDGCVHGKYTHVNTATGRLNSSDPNMQNQPKPPSEVTKHFVSKFEGGKLMAADYSQLDVRCEAEQCQDPNKMNDIIAGVDDHIKNLALSEKMDYNEVKQLVDTDPVWKKKRSKAKGFTFSSQYLALPRTVAKAAGCSDIEAEKFIKARKKEYSKLYTWHENNYNTIKKTGQYNTLTGRILKFKQYTGKYGLYYSPNESANYCTQSLAGDVVATMIGKFWREKAIYNRDKYLMINTVHDNLILDSKIEWVDQAEKDLEMLANWKEVCYIKFNYCWKLDLPVEISVGDSWYECF